MIKVLSHMYLHLAKSWRQIRFTNISRTEDDLFIFPHTAHAAMGQGETSIWLVPKIYMITT